ncbi:hypothetical protein GCM10011391_18450 [Pullulanibacillus camelliae]|uniref:Uncharacterized protein n=1 Tax=Pullulanibacillus camelliae TaxID=1707096 RepID=A0A8J2W017_9BACL|nr:CPBP family intramembrane metalloprotease [Pullulanibacillus camelliae]GGE39940.1 hypothetical protein GCM10011391_18450 [Pullulanibacillus camelliae]
MKYKIRAFFGVRFTPTFDLMMAITTELVMIVFGLISSKTQQLIPGLVINGVLIPLLLSVLVPLLFILAYKKQPLASLGIKKHFLFSSLLISFALSIVLFQSFIPITRDSNHILPLLLHNGLMLWQPFFIYGWLQLRFENAFGPIPSIILSGLCYGLNHLGTLPASILLPYIGLGLFFGLVFKLAESNLFVLFPMTWMVGTTAVQANHSIALQWHGYGLVTILFLCVLFILIGHVARRRRLNQ